MAEAGTIGETTSGANPTSTGTAWVNLPRVTIRYCTQCRWMLRAAYFAQELLSTFSTQIGEIALQPATGGIFTVTIIHVDPAVSETAASPKETLLWDRKTEGGFPETKQLKSLLRNIIDPTRDLGHIDRSLNKPPATTNETTTTTQQLNPPSTSSPPPVPPKTDVSTAPPAAEPSSSTSPSQTKARNRDSLSTSAAPPVPVRNSSTKHHRQSLQLATNREKEKENLNLPEMEGENQGKEVCEDCE